MLDDEALLAGAAALLAARPAASMEDVARAVGISRATLFRRFPSRSALVGALCRQAVEAFAVATEPIDDDGADAASALCGLVARLVPLGARYGLVASQPLDELVERELLARAAAAEDRVRALVRRGQEEGSFRVDVDPEWVLTVLTWLIAGAADGVRLGRLAPARVEAQVTDAVLRLVLRGG
ncbi:TetR/AcrR family transcriptional regulator [Geodermatophilus sp. SYSU D01045]